MSALRKAGVWLGLIEDEDDAAYDDRGYRDGELGDRQRDREHYSRRYSGGVPDELAEDDDDPDDALTERSRTGLGAAAERRGQRRRPDIRSGTRSATGAGGGEFGEASVRSITREPVSYPVRDNLALAPRTQSRPEPVVEEERRYQITTLHPTTYREARTIGEHFREGTPVIMNLTEMDEADARRLVDFGAGLAFGLRGNMERVTNRVFLLSPADVHVTAEDKAKIADGEFFHR